MMLRPGFGFTSFVSSATDDVVQTNFAGLCFGIYLNAQAAGDCDDEGRCGEDGDDPMPKRRNHSALRRFDSGDVQLLFFAGAKYPILCVTSSIHGCPYSTQLCERISDTFCRTFGDEYVRRCLATGPRKSYRKQMAPLIKHLYSEVFADTMDRSMHAVSPGPARSLLAVTYVSSKHGSNVSVGERCSWSRGEAAVGVTAGWVERTLTALAPPPCGISGDGSVAWNRSERDGMVTRLWRWNVTMILFHGPTFQEAAMEGFITRRLYILDEFILCAKENQIDLRCTE